LQRFRETRNRCYNLSVGEKDLADLSFAGLASYLRETMEGQEFMDVNQVLQRAVAHENRAKDHRSYNQFKESNHRDGEKNHVNYVDEESTSEGETEAHVAEWVDTPKDKPISCSFLRPSAAKKDEIKYAFDVSKCDRLFDELVKRGVIRLTEGHIIPSADQLAKKKYCKWHDSYSHTTNECNYFRRQVQSTLNDGRLTLGEGSKMKLDVDPFPMGMENLEERKFLVHSDQASTTHGKNVIVSDELRNWIMVPHNHGVGLWKKENSPRRYTCRVRLTSNMLINKYLRQQQQRHACTRQNNLDGRVQPGCQQRPADFEHDQAWERR
jgi:hypothetical protein